MNDRALRAFLLQNLSDFEYYRARRFTTSHTLYEALRQSHQNFGAQVRLMLQAINTRFNDATSYSQTVSQIERLHQRSTNMGEMDDDKLKILLYINALVGHNLHLESIVNDMLDTPGITSSDVRAKILREEQFIKCQPQANAGTTSDAMALPGTSTSNASVARTRLSCTTCNRLGHLAKFCVKPGGKMEGKTVEEAKIAQRAFLNEEKRKKNGRTNQNLPHSAQVAAIRTHHRCAHEQHLRD